MLRLALGAEKESVQAAQLKPQPHRPRLPTSLRPAIQQQPPYTPELQPAERLWPLVDEAVANTHFATLDALHAAVAERCRRLDAATIRPHTDFHWWPRPNKPN
jgi:hypothetical protein